MRVAAVVPAAGVVGAREHRQAQRRGRMAAMPTIPTAPLRGRPVRLLSGGEMRDTGRASIETAMVSPASDDPAGID